MSYLQLLKRNKFDGDARWIVKWEGDNEDLVREVKLIWDPEQYKDFTRSRKLRTQEELIKILEYDKEIRKTQ